MLADSSMLRRLGGWFGQVHGFADAGKQLDVLDDRLKAVNRALHNLLHVPWSESDRVILTGYPPMALLDDGRTVCPDGHAGMTVLPEFALSEAKAREGNMAAERLQRHHGGQRAPARLDLRRRAPRQPSAAAASARATACSPGPWPTSCACRARSTGRGSPTIPREWRAYAPRQRLFRTPNDAFMTGNFHVSESLMQKVLKTQGYAWVQPLLASVYSGAFHPTAEGQAAIADAVVEQARAVLAKYEARARAGKRGDLGSR